MPTADLTTQQQQPMTHQDNDDIVPNIEDPPTPASPAPPPQQAPTQAPRVITNTPRYDRC